MATGLAWTPVGGEVLFIEATAMPGSGRLTITGQLGDVMRESAQAALSLLRGDAATFLPDLELDATGSPTHDIHLHVPGRRRAQGRALGRGRDDDRPDLAAQRPAGRATTSR